MQQTRTRRQAGSTLITLGTIAFVLGGALAIWAWNLPYGRDPYTTLINSDPGRTEHAIRWAMHSVILAGLGLITLTAGIIVRYVRPGPRSSTTI